MTYHAGIGPGLGLPWPPPCEPHLTCDGCGLVRGVTKRGGIPCAWFLDGKAPPGWRLVRDGDGGRSDYCPRCNTEAKR